MMEFNKKNIRAWSLLGIAPSVFIYGVAEVMRENENVCLITADTGRYCGFQKMDQSLSGRIFNLGIAEQNMIGAAAGMALEGKRVYATTYAPFLAFRGADQFRHLAGNCNLDIKMVGTAAGFSAAESGPALWAVNDIAFVRSIPNMVVLSPADCTEAMKMVLAMGSMSGSVYMRFCGLTNLPIVYKDDFKYEIGKANILKTGAGIAILATGTSIVSEALRAAKILEDSCKIRPTVADIHTIKPLDEDFILSLQETHDVIVTIEEHSTAGGMGSAVSECLAVSGHRYLHQIFIGVEDKRYTMGDRKYMLEQCGLTAQEIAEKICTEIQCNLKGGNR